MLIHRLNYRRTNSNLHVRGYKEEGTITTAFDMRVQNDLDRFHLVQDVVDRLPHLGSRGAYLKQQMPDKFIEHKHYIEKTRPGHAGNLQLEMGRHQLTAQTRIITDLCQPQAHPPNPRSRPDAKDDLKSLRLPEAEHDRCGQTAAN